MPDIIQLSEHDALLLVDVQNDFLPGGALGVDHGDEIIRVLNDMMAQFQAGGLPVIASRDWHPPQHCSFIEQGGIWPVHCVADTDGARFAAALHLPASTVIVSKASSPDQDAYSAFEGTGLHEQLQQRSITRLFVGGLATDYCVLNSVLDALNYGYQVIVLQDAVRAVNVHADDGVKAINKMRETGAHVIDSSQVNPAVQNAEA